MSQLRRARDERLLRRRAIPDALWDLTLARYPFLARRSAADLAALRELATLFLTQKEFHGAQGLQVDDEIAVAIAAQACLPVLRLGLQSYSAFVGIVVHPDEVVARREVMDEDGIVHRYDETLSGEAMEGGPIMLSWRDVEAAGESAEWGYNVVIHEFAHVLDMADGAPDGVPLLPDRAARSEWSRVIDAEYVAFCERVDAGDDTLLDPYGAESVDEFFAVASEVFFVAPDEMKLEHPQLYALFAGYYRQDPAAA
ncbi:MAG TPA: M90 family metallopeptidase [Albitalea sp.]|nr:M90 family metallopeptidase [Albitalea sp.]